MPSGETSPLVTCAVAGMIGSEVIGAPVATLSAVAPGPVVQSSIFVVGLALAWSQ